MSRLLRRSLLLHVALLVVATAAASSVAAAPTEAAVREAMERLLAERFPADAHRLQVRVVRTGAALEAGQAVRLELPAVGALPRAHTQVTVLTEAAGAWEKAGSALLYVAHFDSVVVARQGVSSGKDVADEDLSIAWMETTTFAGAPMRKADLDALRAGGPVVAARPLREGHALRRGDLRPPYAADTGEAVRLTYRRGRLTFQLNTKAREPGAVGDVIRVYAPDTGATYRARLTAPGAAAWVETL